MCIFEEWSLAVMHPIGVVIDHVCAFNILVFDEKFLFLILLFKHMNLNLSSD